MVLRGSLQPASTVPSDEKMIAIDHISKSGPHSRQAAAIEIVRLPDQHIGNRGSSDDARPRVEVSCCGSKQGSSEPMRVPRQTSLGSSVNASQLTGIYENPI